MPGAWRSSPSWLLIAVVVSTFALGIAVPLEVSSYSNAHQKVAVDESLESSFRISYQTQWSVAENHWYGYKVTYGALGLVWGDLWMTVYFNGTTTPIQSGLAQTVVKDGNVTVAIFSFLTGTWNAKGAVALVLPGEAMNLDTAEFGGDGNTLFITAINGTYYGSMSLVIP